MPSFLVGAAVASTAASGYAANKQAKAAKSAANAQREVAQQQLDFAREQWDHFIDVYEPYIVETMEQQTDLLPDQIDAIRRDLDARRQDREFYEDVYRPLERRQAGIYGDIYDKYGKTLDAYDKSLDVYGQSADTYSDYLDSYKRGLDVYGQSADAYGQYLDAYGKSLDMYDTAGDVYQKQAGIYGDIVDDLGQDRTEYVTGIAGAQVDKAFEQQREQQKRELQRYGIDPTSGRYAESDRRSRIAQAGSRAEAINRARFAEEDRQYGRRIAAMQGAPVGIPTAPGYAAGPTNVPGYSSGPTGVPGIPSMATQSFNAPGVTPTYNVGSVPQSPISPSQIGNLYSSAGSQFGAASRTHAGLANMYSRDAGQAAGGLYNIFSNQGGQVYGGFAGGSGYAPTGGSGAYGTPSPATYSFSGGYGGGGTFKDGGPVHGYADGGMVQEQYGIGNQGFNMANAAKPTQFPQATQNTTYQMSQYQQPQHNQMQHGIPGHSNQPQGGPVVGPGNGRSDSVPAGIHKPDGTVVPAALSQGEYVIPQDVVSKVGQGYFDNLIKNYHEYDDENAAKYGINAGGM